MIVFLKHIFSVILSLMILSGIPLTANAQDSKDKTYREQLIEWKQKGIVDTSGTTIEKRADQYKSISEQANIRVGEFGGKQKVLIWDDFSGEIEYKVDVPKDGLYNIFIEYYSTNTLNEAIQRGLMIDGKFPFEETKSFFLEQNIKDAEYPFSSDANGNNMRPKQLEIKEWITVPLRDALAYYEEPLRFHLSKGEHSLKITGGRGTFAFSRFIISSPVEYPSFAEYEKLNTGNAGAHDFLFEVEAEKIHKKSSKSIQVQNIAEAGVTPEAYGTRLFNSIGGTRWRYPNDWVSWEFEVPEDGTYNIAVKYQQSFNTNLDVFRAVEIDGQSPFAEMLAADFPYARSWSNKILGKGQKPYGFFLKKGKHTLTLRATAAPYREVIQDLEKVAEKIQELDLQIKSITGVKDNESIDKYRIWNLNQYIPDLVQRLNGLADEMTVRAQKMSEITGLDSNVFDVLILNALDLRKYAKDTERIPQKPDSLGLIQSQLLTWTASLKTQPIVVDKIYFKSIDREFPPASAGFIKSMAYSIKNFFKSFTMDYMSSGRHNKEAIQVWVQRNRDLVNLMQEYVDQYFTPQTGIEVNVNYMPGQNLLVMANAAGKQPDLASGVGLNIPFEFSLRNTLVDLNTLDGYKDLKETVPPGALLPYHYRKGDFGFPEEVTFPVMYYREDILKKLGVKPPETWEDVKKLLPTLQQNNYNFHYPYGDWLTFFYQSSVNVYKPNGMDIAFDNPNGFQTFKNYTDLYVKYGMPIRLTSFYQHFRLGDIPIGIAPCTDYVTFRLAAPDIAGLWKMKVIPGVKQQDGSVTRWNGGGAKGMMMFKTTPERQKKSWEYMKWWLSTDVQAQFANDLESYYGLEFRWYPANVEAVKRIPWAPEEKQVILEQMSWLKEIPYVPGGSYITSREIQNAMTRTIIDKGNYREELEKSIDEIRREINRKQQEFGLVDKNGNIVETLDIPQVPLPGKER